jgi:DNA polymerase (family 10)
MKNEEIARIFSNIAVYLQMKNDSSFRIRAYEKAAVLIESMAEELSDIYSKGGLDALMEIEGIGEGLAKKIEEMIKTGRLKFYEKLKKQVPVDVEALDRIEGIGPKTILILYKKLKVKNIKDLEKAAKAGKIRRLRDFGERSEEKILKGISFLKKSSGRFILGYIYPEIKDIESRLNSLPYVEKAIIAGSVRRMKETIGDVDVLVISEHPKKVMDYFTKMPEVINIIGKGMTKSSVKIENGLDVDLRVVKKNSYGAALNYFTGSKDHNVALRRIALQKKMKLSEYGLFRGKKQIAGKTEQDVYKILGLRYIEPELRENKGELEAARSNKLPKLIKYNDLKGDLQTQTKWTDGSDSIEELANAAKKQGLDYIAITDHTKSLSVTNGLDEKRLAKQGKEIDKVNKKVGITILKGAEVNVKKDGSLDISDKALSGLDVVGIAVHSNFSLPRTEMTRRIIRAMENPNADILFHPTGRIIQRREAYGIDMEKIIDAAKETGTVLEINALPDRLDLNAEHIRMAVESGVKLSIDSDAHKKDHLEYLKFGIAQARRGWAEKKDIINAWPLNKMLKMIKG